MNLPDLSKMNLSGEELVLAEKILRELASKGNSDAYKQMMYLHYEEIPVSIEHFITNPDLLGKSCTEDGGAPGSAMYPYWREAIAEIMHGGKSFQEVILAGGIGLGKSWVACVMCCYLLYRLLCLKNPQSYYKLAPNEPIVFAFFNIHKYVSLDVAYGKFQRMLQSSPWFLRHGEIRGVKNREYYPRKNIEFTVGYNNDAAIGKNIFVAVLDEMSFAKHANADMMKSGIMDLYRSVDARMISRFTIGGIFHGKKFLISSKKSDSDFLDQYAESQKNNPLTYIVDEPQWVVKPEGTFSKETFRLAVGSKTKISAIIADDDPRSDSDILATGYTQIIYPPQSLKPKFEFDMDASLRDLAGVSTTIFTKFISYDKLERCYSSKLINGFTNVRPIIGLTDQSQLMDYFDLNRIPDWIRELPGFLHLDIAYAGDGYGLGYTAVAGTKQHTRIQTGEQVTDPVYLAVFAASIKAPKGDQVSLEKVRQFIYWLKYTCNFNLKRVSTDGFSSADTRQAMITRGIDSDLISCDRVPCNPYITLRTAVYERRYISFQDDFIENELIFLERNEMTGKVDHPLNGSKDCADGLAGSVYNASMHQEQYSPVAKSVELLLEVNESKNFENSTEAELEAQLMDIIKKKPNDGRSQVITDDDSADEILEKVTGFAPSSAEGGEKLTEEMRLYYASLGIII